MSDPIPAQRERQALCDLFEQVGPDAPTLSGDWTTRDLAAHLIVRERRPDAAGGILIAALAGRTERVQADIAERPWTELVAEVRNGPPRWSPMRFEPADRAANTIEFFVHHEDVRRARDEWTVRDLDPDTRNDLHRALKRMARPLARSAEVGIVLDATDTGGTDPIVAKRAEPSGTICGPVGEIVLYIYGRRDQAEIELDGADDTVAAIESATFGI
ncbi:MAG: TIGR03085 family protein [Ilumatobacteraceae bacterium]|nr:TIGR03085 family protein [Ilumatobacteraceae bacterium]